MAGRERRGRRTALLLSLLIHLILLAPLLMVPVARRPPQSSSPGDVLLELVPEAGLAIDSSRPSRASAAGLTTRAGAIVQPSRTMSAAASPTGSRQPMSPGAQPTSPASADAGSPLGANSADQDAVRRALQAALACAAGASRNLDDDARAACRKRLIEGAAAMGEAKVNTIPPLKRAYYDAVQKAYQDFRSFPTPDTELTHLPGAEGMYDQRVASMPGRPGGVGCGLKFGGPNSPHLKIGPITCAVILPASPLNPEVDLPHADQIPGK